MDAIKVVPSGQQPREESVWLQMAAEGQSEEVQFKKALKEPLKWFCSESTWDSHKSSCDLYMQSVCETSAYTHVHTHLHTQHCTKCNRIALKMEKQWEERIH